MLSKTHEAEKQRQSLRVAAYVDYLRGVTTTSQAQKRGDKPEEAKGNALMADAKARICVYGTDETVKALAEFSRVGAKLSTREGVDAFLSFCVEMRREMRGGDSPRDDIARVLFNTTIADFAPRGAAADSEVPKKLV